MKQSVSAKSIVLLVVGIVVVVVGAAAVLGYFDIVLHNTYQPLTVYDQALIVRQRHDLVRWAGGIAIVAGAALVLTAFSKRR